MDKEIQRVTQRYRSVNWKDKNVYGDYLAQTYYYVGYSTRLLALAAGNMRLEDNAYFKRYIKHITEESSHEKLAQRDLENLGCSLEEFSELSETRMFYESQFYKIEHVDPLSFMGYVLLLESLAVQECPAVTKTVSEVHGKKCASFVKLHGEEDPDHVDKAMAMLNELPQERLARVFQNLKQTADGFINILNAIEQRQLELSWKKSA